MRLADGNDWAASLVLAEKQLQNLNMLICNKRWAEAHLSLLAAKDQLDDVLSYVKRQK